MRWGTVLVLMLVVGGCEAELSWVLEGGDVSDSCQGDFELDGTQSIHLSELLEPSANSTTHVLETDRCIWAIAVEGTVVPQYRALVRPGLGPTLLELRRLDFEQLADDELRIYREHHTTFASGIECDVTTTVRLRR